MVYIDSERIHKKRFTKREIEAPNREMNKYLSNFTEIRWIHDYLLHRAKRYEHISRINNSEEIEKSLDAMLRTGST